MRSFQGVRFEECTVKVDLDLKKPATVIVPFNAVASMDDAGTDDDFDKSF